MLSLLLFVMRWWSRALRPRRWLPRRLDGVRLEEAGRHQLVVRLHDLLTGGPVRRRYIVNARGVVQAQVRRPVLGGVQLVEVVELRDVGLRLRAWPLVVVVVLVSR